MPKGSSGKAVSKSQARLMAGCSHGWHPAGVQCPDMPVAQMKEYARTPTKNLPERKRPPKR